jgi:hypothetical protein
MSSRQQSAASATSPPRSATYINGWYDRAHQSMDLKQPTKSSKKPTAKQLQMRATSDQIDAEEIWPRLAPLERSVE